MDSSVSACRGFPSKTPSWFCEHVFGANPFRIFCLMWAVLQLRCAADQGHVHLMAQTLQPPLLPPASPAHHHATPRSNPHRPPRVLVPGAGLARLCVEVAALGYEAQGNEFSYFMLLAWVRAKEGGQGQGQGQGQGFL